jgi:heme/copper-type cytochrome/quinol oxidase subunit 3
MNDTRAMSRPARSARPSALGLGVFAGSAVILFGGLLSVYALLRINNPGAFSWAPSLLDRRLLVFTAAALIVAGLAAAGTLRLALSANIEIARPLLVVALLAGAAVVVLRALEFPETSRRAGFEIARKPAAVATTSHGGAPATATSHIGDASQGKRVFLGTCAACHAPDGSGIKGQGQNLRDSVFLKGKTDDQALAFVKIGRQPFDPESKLHLAMPARGGNPSLSDASLLDAIAFVRELQKQSTAIQPVSAATAVARPSIPPSSSDQPQIVEGELWLPHTILPASQTGPSGLARLQIALQKPGALGHMESSVRRFFSIVLVMDGLHTLYVLFGLALGCWLLLGGWRSAPKSSLAMAAAYWLVIAVIGMLLIPAFYV